jgi:hypothetical protein
MAAFGALQKYEGQGDRARAHQRYQILCAKLSDGAML